MSNKEELEIESKLQDLYHKSTKAKKYNNYFEVNRLNDEIGDLENKLMENEN